MLKSERLLKKIQRIGPVVHGSLVEMKRTCGKPQCRCARGEKHKAFYISRRLDGKTRLDHVSKSRVKDVRKWRRNYEHLEDLVQQLTTALLQELRDDKE